MDRPVNLRPDLFHTIEAQLSRLDNQALYAVLLSAGYAVNASADRTMLLSELFAEPSRFLAAEHNILKDAQCLAGLFIEFNDDELDAGHTYLIDREAAEEIAAGQKMILLRSGAEGALVPRSRIERAFAEGCLIDYQESSSESESP